MMLFCLFAFAFSIARRTHRPDYLQQTPKEKRKLSKRTIAATGLILLLIPLTLFIKKQLEKEFLCEKLCRHITYDLTDYRPAPWYQQHFIMKYDDEVLLDVCQPERIWDKRYESKGLYWAHSHSIAAKLYPKYDLAEYDLPTRIVESLIGEAINKADKLASHHKGIYGVHDIIDFDRCLSPFGY